MVCAPAAPTGQPGGSVGCDPGASTRPSYSRLVPSEVTITRFATSNAAAAVPKRQSTLGTRPMGRKTSRVRLAPVSSPLEQAPRSYGRWGSPANTTISPPKPARPSSFTAAKPAAPPPTTTTRRACAA